MSLRNPISFLIVLVFFFYSVKGGRFKCWLWGGEECKKSSKMLSEYDVEISISVFRKFSEKGWNVSCRKREYCQLMNLPQNNAITTILGSGNSGKTFLLNEILGVDFGSSSNVHTKGLSFVITEDRGMFIDTFPLKKTYSDEERKDRKEIETFVLEFLLSISDVIYVLTGQLSHQDEDLIDFAVKNSGIGAELRFVHNFKGIEDTVELQKIVNKTIWGKYVNRSVLQNTRGMGGGRHPSFILEKYPSKLRIYTTHYVIGNHEKLQRHNSKVMEIFRSSSQNVGSRVSEHYVFMEEFSNALKLYCSKIIQKGGAGLSISYENDFDDLHYILRPENDESSLNYHRCSMGQNKRNPSRLKMKDEVDGNYHVAMEMPGVNPHDVRLSVHPNPNDLTERVVELMGKRELPDFLEDLEKFEGEEDLKKKFNMNFHYTEIVEMNLAHSKMKDFDRFCYEIREESGVFQITIFSPDKCAQRMIENQENNQKKVGYGTGKKIIIFLFSFVHFWGMMLWFHLIVTGKTDLVRNWFVSLIGLVWLRLVWLFNFLQKFFLSLKDTRVT